MSRKKQVYEKITALYCRISLDDGGDNESMSISNQKLMLRDFAEKHGMFQYEYYVDDGYTGRNFNRPSFQRMIADIEAGKIGCVVTKDLSRLGRNYIEAGSYIEIFFPKHNVRYIAVTDGVDSLTRQEMDITPFKNILNDMYSRDISKKVLAGRMTRSRQGKFCGGQPPLGLMRDPEDKGHLILDPETAPVIRKIYDMALDGWGCMRIAKQLMDDKIPITRVKSNTECDVNYYSWGSARISHILRNPFYKGAHLVCRTHQKGIRSNTYDIIPREEWEVIEGCHEAIVTPEEWEQVQEIRSFFLAVLFPNPQFKIDEVSFCADICHNWCISVKTLVGTGYAFLIGFRIVKGGYINIDRNKAVIQGCRLYVHFTQHVDICLLDVFAQGIPDHVKTLTECFGGRNRIGDA